MTVSSPDLRLVPLFDDAGLFDYLIRHGSDGGLRWTQAHTFRPLLEPGHVIVVHSRCDCDGVPLNHAPPLPDWDAYLETGRPEDL